jgi:TPP-dependent pyruvate/acetoin dehydrogenase alpha subunit
MKDGNNSNVQALSEERARQILDQIGPQKARQMLETLFTIRAFEEKAEELYGLGKVHGTMHLSIGQEGTAGGVSNALRSGHDYLLNHHRGHGHCLRLGRRCERHDGRVYGQGDRLLPGSGRVHAYRRCREQQPGCKRDRRRRYPSIGWGRPQHQAAPNRPGLPGGVWRWRSE